MSMETLSFEKRGSVGILRINRPEALNALNNQVLNELEEFFDSFPKSIRCLIITGEGEKSFVAGADIKEMEINDYEKALKKAQRGQALFDRIETLNIPTIAAINGFALGGGFELALACDFIVASERAKFGLPEVSLGLIPGYGGTQRLARTIGKGRARMITLTGDIYRAQQAYDWGIAVRLTPPDQLISECMQLAEKIAAQSPAALALAKRSINEGFDLSQYEGMKLEAEIFAETFKTKDHVEGITAFVEKRRPQFTGE